MEGNKEKSIYEKEICGRCRKERMKKFPQVVEKERIGGEFSPFFEGFSNDQIYDNVDILIISESIGNLHHHMNKIKEGKNPQEVLKNYYLTDKLETFNQQETRKLLNSILEMKKTFYFTDVVKCFVKKEKKNFEYAAKYCTQNYLKRQIKLLKPKIVILLGRTAEKAFFDIVETNKKLKHGESFQVDGMTAIFSQFPSAINVDKLVKEGGIEKVITSLKML